MTKRSSGGLAVIIIAVLTVQMGVVTQVTAEPAWPQWRGPARDGVAVEAKLPRTWPKELKPVWNVEVGVGHSSPVTVGEKVVLMARQGEDEITLCLSVRDGRVLWRNAYTAPYKPRSDAAPHGKGPKATSTIAGGKVYSFGITGVLSCLDIERGKLIWRKEFPGEYKKTWPLYGTANSPLIEGNLCILGVGGHNNGAIAAFNKDTGALVWKLADGPSYSSPIAATVAGSRQVITMTQTRVVGLDPNKGTPLWQVPFKTAYDMNSMTPVVYKDFVIYGGYHKPTTAIQLVKKGEEFAAKQVWQNDELQLHMSSPVVREAHLYGVSHRTGKLMCVNLADGSAVWTSSDKFRKYASLILVEDQILLLGIKGDLHVVAADPSGYKERARFKLTDRPTWAHVGLCGSRLYVKDKTHMACFELPGR